MSGSSAKNYLQSGDTWVIGGEIQLVGDGVITKDGQPVVGGDGGGLDIPDGSITTSKIASKAVTDDKLANPKVDVPPTLIPKMVIGTTLEGNELGIVPYEQTPTADHLAMYQFGGQLATAAPVADSDAANKKYVDDNVSGVTWSTLTGKPATFSPTIGTTGTTAAAGNHTHTAATTSAPGFMSAADKTKLDGVSANAVNAAGAVSAVAAKAQIAALVPIADPATATVEQVATLLNSFIAAAKA